MARANSQGLSPTALRAKRARDLAAAKHLYVEQEKLKTKG